MPLPLDSSTDRTALNARSPIPADASYEQLAGLLQEQVERLERGDLTLAEALATYERGVELVRRCGDLLDSAQLRVSTLSTEAEAAMNGEISSAHVENDGDWAEPDDDVPF
ncbi:MAG TPA: exodeoxyribonuclease VII small subunit [Thermomicrobiaceae bacterium]|nr:exodeoxyribonuclease VII small subunit [Thermomicrobiaceae bacterium]